MGLIFMQNHRGVAGCDEVSHPVSGCGKHVEKSEPQRFNQRLQFFRLVKRGIVENLL